MTAPNELKNLTLKQLRETREAMLELDYLMALEELSDEKQRDAALELSRTQSAYLRLRKTALEEIRKKLEENEKELLSGIESLQKTLTDLTKVEQIIAATAKLLGVVGRVIRIIA
jgi:hypothetical protein